MGGSVIYTRSLRIKRVTKSSTETELMATTDQIPNTLWISHFQESLHIPIILTIPTIIVRQDNQSTLSMINRGASGNQVTRYMEIRHYWITDYLVHNELAFKYCPTEEMVADLFTKGVTTSLFNKHKRQLNIR